MFVARHDLTQLPLRTRVMLALGIALALAGFALAAGTAFA